MSLKIPSETDPVWRNIVTGKVKYQFDFVAAKILLGHLMVKISHNPSPEIIDAGARELREVFARNVRMPSVQRDLKKILG